MTELRYRIELKLSNGDTLTTHVCGTRSNIMNYYSGRLMIHDVVTHVNSAGVTIDCQPVIVESVKFLDIA